MFVIGRSKVFDIAHGRHFAGHVYQLGVAVLGETLQKFKGRNPADVEARHKHSFGLPDDVPACKDATELALRTLRVPRQRRVGGDYGTVQPPRHVATTVELPTTDEGTDELIDPSL